MSHKDPLQTTLLHPHPDRPVRLVTLSLNTLSSSCSKGNHLDLWIAFFVLVRKVWSSSNKVQGRGEAEVLISDGKKYRLKRVFMVCFYVGSFWDQGTWELRFKQLLVIMVSTALPRIRFITHENCPGQRCTRSVYTWVDTEYTPSSRVMGHSDQILNTWPWRIDICTKSGDNLNILMSHWEESGPFAPGSSHEGHGWR